ncbi:MAG: iron chelate uptake ABC transporter family permease subunit [Dehalococcoidia bacterium]|nr:iron chelate uptake ABC transporter family permease subunit [Dehalococcoidia bacterium]
MSLRVNLRVIVLIALGVAALALLAAWAMTLGTFPVPLSDVARPLIGQDADEHDLIVRTLRLPHVLSAAMVGALLAMSGAIFQGLVRNALMALLPLAAFLGAVAAAALVYVLTWRGGISGSRMILVGIGVNAGLSALTTFLIVRSHQACEQRLRLDHRVRRRQRPRRCDAARRRPRSSRCGGWSQPRRQTGCS